MEPPSKGLGGWFNFWVDGARRHGNASSVSYDEADSDARPLWVLKTPSGHKKRGFWRFHSHLQLTLPRTPLRS